MSVDITLQPLQAEIEDSILEAPIVAQIPHVGGEWRQAPGEEQAEHGESVFDDPSDYFAEAVYKQEHNAAVLGDEGLQRKLDQEQEQGQGLRGSMQERLRSERPEAMERPETGGNQAEQGQTQEQAQPATVEEASAAIEALAGAASKLGLNTQQNREEYASEFCAALGTDPHQAKINIDAMADLRYMTAVSSLGAYEACGGDPNKVPPIDPLMAQEYHHRFFTSWNLDPWKFSQVDPMLLATTARRWDMNIIDTWYRMGKTLDLARLTAKETAMQGLREFYELFGIQREPDEDTARAVAYAYTKPQLYALVACEQWKTQQAASQAQGRRSGGRGHGQRVPAGMRDGIRGSKVQTFSSNRDIFSGQVMNDLAMRRL